MVITQDSNLSDDILGCNNLKSQYGYDIYVAKIDENGYLKRHYSKTNFAIKVNKNDCYKICSTVTSVADELINVTHIPGENEEVYDSNGGIYKLIKLFGTGGEGSVYEVDNNLVAKIYNKKSITQWRYNKIGLMLSKHNQCEGICFPLKFLYNKNKEFVGYLMPKAIGCELKDIFIKPKFEKNFQDGKRKILYNFV